MKIAYFKNVNKMLAFLESNTVAHVFANNGFICVVYYANEDSAK